jgi:NAD(P)-dependent dehydrogenase (short-subunit alcohol dehydrogenase family)
MKVALVTGAAQGLGLVTACHLAKLGLRVILSDIQDLRGATARMRTSRYLGAQMLGRRRGSIVNVASVAGLAGISHRSAYNASKHGLIGLTRTLAAEWGGRGVRVTAICPAWIKTEMDVADQQRGAYSDQDIIDRVPMARFAAPDDVAQAIMFLADDEKSGFVNGATLTVDGGWIADASWEKLRRATRRSD